MKHSHLSRAFALLLAVIMLVSVLPMNALAASEYDDSNGGSDYYNIISEKEWAIAPGVKEIEQVMNNDAGTRRQVMHTAIVDVNNPYVKVIPGTKGMWPQEGNYGVQSTSTQALEAEKLGYGNVVVATNCSLSWYTEAYYQQNPHLIGEPLGYSILDGEYYCNSRISNGTLKTGGVQTIVETVCVADNAVDDLLVHLMLSQHFLCLDAVFLGVQLKIDIVEDAYHFPELSFVAVAQFLGIPAQNTANGFGVLTVEGILIVFAYQFPGFVTV